MSEIVVDHWPLIVCPGHPAGENSDCETKMSTDVDGPAETVVSRTPASNT